MKRHITVVGSVLTLIICFASVSTVSAASANISRSYSSSTSIPNGSLVSLVRGKTNEVQQTNGSNSARLIGVAVSSSQSLLAVNPTTGSVQVATDGTANTLVSTVNGNISAGQQIAVSPFNGIGMKSGPGDRVVGTAVTGFNSSTEGAVSEQVTDSHGNKHSITAGYIKLDISIGTAISSNFSLQGIQQYVESLTGRPISVLRLVISTIVTFVAILSIIVLIYASIYGSIVSIGRNPLAKYAVFRTLSSVVVMVSLIAVVACVAVYSLVY